MASREEQEAAAERAFTAIGMAPNTVQQSVRNRKMRDALMETLAAAGVAETGCEKSVGDLLYTVSTKYPPNALSHRPALLARILDGRIAKPKQLTAALSYLASVGSGDDTACSSAPAPASASAASAASAASSSAADPASAAGAFFDESALDEAAGVGVVVTDAQIEETVNSLIEENKAALVEQRYRFPSIMLVKKANEALRWAEGATVKSCVDAAVLRLLGPCTKEDDEAAKVKVKAPLKISVAAAAQAEEKKKEEAAEQAAAAKEAEEGSAAAAAASSSIPDDPYSSFASPADNNKVHTSVPMSDGSVLRIANTREQLAEHLKRTGGVVMTRFPPEPNGYLHLGHAKACFIDFGLAENREGGKCYLRFDDTNPEAEKQEYIDHINEIVRWLGWKPWKVTHTADYFGQLHDIAVDLIKRDKAYVCHQTQEQVKAAREAREGSPFRDRPARESLELFAEMTKGNVAEGAATLRLKIDPKNNNLNMFDPVAYRIKFAEHPRSGKQWCVYPSYDFAHCLVDSLEDITHSLCTLEFETRRASYYWLLEEAGLYKPVVWEYSRLSVTHNVMSKRKLATLVRERRVRGWDDPRLLTLSGLRRRGATPGALLSFCRDVGITRSDGGEVKHQLLDHHIRADVDPLSKRCLAVLRPLKLVITNAEELGAGETFHGRTWPNKKAGERGADETYPLPLSSPVLYIDRSDFRTEDCKGYFGLAPGKAVLLKYAGVFTAAAAGGNSGKGFDAAPAAAGGASGEEEPECVFGTFAPLAEGAKPPKGVLSWVGEPSPGVKPFEFEARLYGPLFKSESPGSLPVPEGGDKNSWLDDVDPASEEIVRGAFGSTPLADAKPGDRFQFERLGFFIVDADRSEDGKAVLNRTCTLRESVATKVVRKA